MIEYFWELWSQMMGYLSTNFDPWRDTIDLLLVSLAVYWLLLLIRGTRAVQILMGSGEGTRLPPVRTPLPPETRGIPRRT